MQPQVEQYGSHMVMTNVVKPIKHKHIHLDTKFRDETTSDSSMIDVNFTLPDRITNVRSATVLGADIPFTFYNLPYQDCSVKPTTNNCFKYTISSYNAELNNILDTQKHIVVISPGHITPANLCLAINNQLSSYNIDMPAKQSKDDQIVIVVNYPIGNLFKIGYASDINQYYFTLSAGCIVTIDFTVNSTGMADSLEIKNKLGWVMGFRTPTLTLNNKKSNGLLDGLDDSDVYHADNADIEFYSDQPSTGFPYPKYFYIVLEDYSRTPNNSVITPLAKAYNIPKNIIAKVMCDTSVGRGNTIFCSAANGRLISDTRIYGKTDLSRLRIQLVDDEGIVVDLNGGELSLTLDIEHE